MAVLKYKDPVTGEVKKVGSPVDAYTKIEADNKFTPIHGTDDLIDGESPLASGKLYFVIEG